MEEIQRRLALKFRLNKIENSGIFGPILLNELFNHTKIRSKMTMMMGLRRIKIIVRPSTQKAPFLAAPPSLPTILRF